MQQFGRLKVFAAVSTIVVGTYSYADYMSSVDGNERQIYFPAADVALVQHPDEAGDESEVVQAAAPDASGEFSEDADAVH